MAQNFTAPVPFEGRSLLAVIVPTMRGNGMHYEVNIPGYQRFWVRWGALGRYELVRPANAGIPEALVLAVSDTIEARS